jgi:ubiquinone/menaquinone biosynthesis C-methylase UbiE
MNEAERQRRFHRTADAPRLRNRLDNPWIVPRERRLAAKLAAFCPPDGRVLEVGCGEGTNLAFLAALRPAARLYGLDFSEAKVAWAASCLPGPVYACADAQALPFPDGRFDCVFCRDLLHHVDFNREGVLAEMLRVLAPGGTAVILEARGATPLNWLFQRLFPVERGLARSTPESLLALGAGLARAQLEFVEASLATRALGFVLGWEAGGFRSLARNVVYAPTRALELVLEKIVPRRRWAMMLASYRKAGEPQPFGRATGASPDQ